MRTIAALAAGCGQCIGSCRPAQARGPVVRINVGKTISSHHSVSTVVVLQSNRQQALKPIKYARRLPDIIRLDMAHSNVVVFYQDPDPAIQPMVWRGASFAPLTEEFYER